MHVSPVLLTIIGGVQRYTHIGDFYIDIDCRYPGTPDEAVSRKDQCDGHPTLYAATLPRGGLIPFFHKASGYAFKHILLLHAKEVCHVDNEWCEVTALPGASLQVLFLSPPFLPFGGTYPETCSGERGHQYS